MLKLVSKATTLSYLTDLGLQFVAAGLVWMRPVTLATVFAGEFVNHEFVALAFLADPTTSVSLQIAKRIKQSDLRHVFRCQSLSCSGAH